MNQGWERARSASRASALPVLVFAKQPATFRLFVLAKKTSSPESRELLPFHSYEISNRYETIAVSRQGSTVKFDSR